jgi:hypothetical protein
MEINYPDLIESLMQLAVMIICALLTVRFLKKVRFTIVMGFFLYATICLIIGNMYWILTTVLKVGVRIPYGINEVSSTGAWLLFASMFNKIFYKERPKRGFETVQIAVISVVLIVLWTIWSGEWIESVAGGVPLCYLMYIIVLAMKKTGAFGTIEKVFIIVSTYTVLILQIISLSLESEIVKAVFEYTTYVILFAVFVFLLVKGLRGLLRIRRDRDTSEDEIKKVLVVNFVSLVWILNTTYMCYEPVYFLADFMYAVALLIVMFTCFELEKRPESLRTEQIAKGGA